jgi:hypothetical protein
VYSTIEVEPTSQQHRFTSGGSARATQQLDLGRMVGDLEAEQRITGVNCRKIADELFQCQLIIKLTDGWAFEAPFIKLKWHSDPSPPRHCRYRCHGCRPLPLLALLALAVEGIRSRALLFSPNSRPRQCGRHSLR